MHDFRSAPRSSRWVLAAWLVLMAACVALVATSRYSTDMSAFLPSDPDARQRLLVDQIKDGALSRMILMGIDGGTPEARAAASAQLAATLRQSNAFAGVVNGDAASRDIDQALLLRYRYVLSPQVNAARFSTQGLHDAIGHTLADLSGSAGLLLKSLLPRDPTGELWATLETVAGGHAPASSEGAWSSADGQRALLVTMTRPSGTDTDAQENALRFVHQSFDALNTEGVLQLRMSGTPVFAVHARATIRSEIERLSLLGGLGIFALLFGVYRSWRNVAIGLLPVVSGILVAIAAVALSFDTVHAITIGFGTTLIGEAIDYSIYYLVQAHDPKTWRRTFWPTIRLGVATSVCGFAVLLLSSFPGLAQLGAYSVAGLITAALVTRFVLPALPTAPVPLSRIDRLGRAAGRLVAIMQRLRWPVAFLALAALALLFNARSQLWAPGLSGLNPAPLDMQKLDAELRQDAGTPDLQHMVVVTAATQEAALRAAEQTEQRLQPLLASGVLTQIASPTHFLPSQALQQQRLAALPEPEELQERLAAALEGLPIKKERLTPFAQDVASAHAQGPLSTDALAGSSFAFGVQTLLLPRDGQWSVLMPLRLPAGAATARPDDLKNAVTPLLDAGAGSAEAFYVNLDEQAASTFGQYLQQALVLSLAGSLGVLLLVAAALRDLRLTLRVLAPLVGAVTLVMAAHVVLSVRMTLLHLVGLLLIVAVGSNYALFFNQRIAPAGDASTTRTAALASLVLANVSTILGFGVLALSNVPVLHAIGSTVGPGALLALLLAMSWSAGEPRGTERA
ncbi:MMPL family transporter [Ottowia testudinis]|uniref:MMPL family transporter n=1 Tax=Ottowia testudinis TaxID=2816950 RepID=A0A975CCD3_9BURK|nr:MMPL family transporter [Ottowia testudinis]QTD43690.1 MMPL family transporter [Ottowia testudinis]